MSEKIFTQIWMTHGESLVKQALTRRIILECISFIVDKIPRACIC